MERFDDAIATFLHAVERARQMVSLFDALSAIRIRDPANDDALRSAYILAVSSFDFFAHELALVEAKHRFRSSLKTRNITLPMELMTINDAEERSNAAESQIRQSNSYKAFVDPAKLAEMLSCYCANPWQKITERLNEGKVVGDRRTDVQVKGQLKSIWKRRNQIAHEADVNPTLAGITLWPIDKPDTELTIAFILELGEHLPGVIAEALPEED
ncbi:hypothetical protein EF888_02315 [Silicimonas algicola]|uniref:RiboL-PSP-HEPN domain-containing protein n=1 Tax=Silicimonas algicola TaxID=1826607 RepID=A0A316GEI6_9RHOB|nr:HEPN domain-containing protein [Silicimonas algicola]AZQ66058.1 hypothetical protein EF888_02315 [Silicimonas algicola]PWK58356.1 hypothetical protein C8D95_101169 [Silicimonas algicola]